MLGSKQQIVIRCSACMQAVVVPSLEETPEQGAEEAIVEHKVNYDYLLSMPISSLTLEKVGRADVLKAHSPCNTGVQTTLPKVACCHETEVER